MILKFLKSLNYRNDLRRKASSGLSISRGILVFFNNLIVEEIANRMTRDLSTIANLAISSIIFESSSGKRIVYLESFFIFFVTNKNEETLLSAIGLFLRIVNNLNH